VAKKTKNRSSLLVLIGIAAVLGVIAAQAKMHRTSGESAGLLNVEKSSPSVSPSPSVNPLHDGTPNKTSFNATPAPNPSVTPAIIAASAFITRGGQLSGTTDIQIRATVSGTNSGTCNLTLTGPNSETMHRSAAVVIDGSAATCQGFDLTTADFTAAGSWKAVISVTTAAGTSSPSEPLSFMVTK
jgi:hypothetical protein